MDKDPSSLVDSKRLELSSGILDSPQTPPFDRTRDSPNGIVPLPLVWDQDSPVRTYPRDRARQLNSPTSTAWERSRDPPTGDLFRGSVMSTDSAPISETSAQTASIPRSPKGNNAVDHTRVRSHAIGNPPRAVFQRTQSANYRTNPVPPGYPSPPRASHASGVFRPITSYGTIPRSPSISRVDTSPATTSSGRNADVNGSTAVMSLVLPPPVPRVGGRMALLSSIKIFEKTTLRHCETNDRSAPVIVEEPSQADW